MKMFWAVSTSLVQYEAYYYKVNWIKTQKHVYEQCPALKDENDLFRQIFYRNGADLCLFPPCQTSQILPSIYMDVCTSDLLIKTQISNNYTKVVSSDPAHGKVYSIQHYMKKFVSGLRQIDGFLRTHRFSSLIKLKATI